MTVRVNMDRPFTVIKSLSKNDSFVDRSEIIEHLNAGFGTDNKYVCITTQKCLGKTVMANMIASYYSKSVESRLLFDNMHICESPEYEKHINRHNVILLNMRQNRRGKTFASYICGIEEKVIREMKRLFPEVKVSINNTLRNNFNKIYLRTGQKFIFILDEWDYILRYSNFSEDEIREYLKFMAELVTDNEYAELAYITGEYPITTYTDMKQLMVFDEFTFNPSDEAEDNAYDSDEVYTEDNASGF